MESAEPAKSAESAAGAGNESGRFIVQSLTEKTVGPDNGAVAAQICAAAGSSGKIGFFDEHGLDAGLAGPGRKIRQGETLPKAGSSGAGRWTGWARQENSSRGNAAESRFVGENRR